MAGIPRYELPRERQQLKEDWWTASQAARAWGVSPKTARRVFDTLDEVTTIRVIDVRRGKERLLQCVRPGTLRPPVRRGNPRFADPEYQRANSARRWDGHITAAQMAEFKAEMDAEAFQELVDFSGEMLGNPPAESVDDWEPPPFEPDPEPPEPHFLYRFERDAYERKQARLARGCTH